MSKNNQGHQLTLQRFGNLLKRSQVVGLTYDSSALISKGAPLSSKAKIGILTDPETKEKRIGADVIFAPLTAESRNQLKFMQNTLEGLAAGKTLAEIKPKGIELQQPGVSQDDWQLAMALTFNNVQLTENSYHIGKHEVIMVTILSKELGLEQTGYQQLEVFLMPKADTHVEVLHPLGFFSNELLTPKSLVTLKSLLLGSALGETPISLSINTTSLRGYLQLTHDSGSKLAVDEVETTAGVVTMPVSRMYGWLSSPENGTYVLTMDTNKKRVRTLDKAQYSLLVATI